MEQRFVHRSCQPRETAMYPSCRKCPRAFHYELAANERAFRQICCSFGGIRIILISDFRRLDSHWLPE